MFGFLYIWPPSPPHDPVIVKHFHIELGKITASNKPVRTDCVVGSYYNSSKHGNKTKLA